MTLKSTAAILALTAATTANAKLEAHEWGTFTSVVGSNGLSQRGLYHEDERLPSFVYGFGETRTPDPGPLPTPDDDCVFTKGGCFPRRHLTSVTQKMETPVIYFYSDKDQHVDVRVQFPKGAVTETYPAPIATVPTLRNMIGFEKGDTTFSVDVKTALGPYEYLPYVDATNIYGHARNVASRYVKSGNDVEKFIFYRGLGHFQTKIAMTSMNGRLSLSAASNAVPKAAFLVHVDATGDGQMLPLRGFVEKGSQIVPKVMTDRLARHDGLPDKRVIRGPLMAANLVASLVSSGLYEDEAKAMVSTWEHGYLKVPGLRLLYVLPRTEVDDLLPLTMTPVPEKLERVFVGRLEVLLDTEEERILTLATQPFFRADSLGRFKEPILRRVAEVYAARERSAGRTPDPVFTSRLESLITEAATQVDISGTVVTH